MTRETEKAFVIIYSEYLRRRSFGTAKSQALFFKRERLYMIDAFANWDPGDIRYALHEIKKCGFVAIDIFGNVEILEAGIDYAERKPREYWDSFSGVINDLLSLAAQFLSL